jgi:hypothetical protein
VARQRSNLLTRLEDDVLDPGVQLSDLLRTCIVLAGRTQAAQLRAWATTELNGYTDRESVPEYRIVAAPIMWEVAEAFRGVSTLPVNVQELPGFVREHINEDVHLNQSIDTLEGLVRDYQGRNERVHLGIPGGDIWLDIWNENNGGNARALRMYWSLDPVVIRGVLGRVRTALAEFIAELRSEVGDSDQLPSAEQTDEALRTAVPSAVINNSNVTIMTTKEGDIMPDGDRTTIKGNTTKIEGASGNISVASANVNQVNAEGVDVEKIREFAALIAQIAPILGLAEVQQAELESGANELQAALSAPVPEKGRLRRAVDRVMGVLRGAGPTAARMVATGMGDELMRELGSGILGQLPH